VDLAYDTVTGSFVKRDAAGNTETIGGSGVSGDGTGITDAGAFRAELEAQSTSIGFLNRFGRLANTTAITNDSTPEVGENIYIVNESTRTGGTTTGGSANISFTSNGTAPIVGSVVSGTGIPGGTTVLSSTTTTAVLSANVTPPSSAGLTFTFRHPNPTVQSEALEAAAGTLIYYGANVATPNQRISLTVWAELRLNASWNGSGTTAPDITFGINATAWNSTLGLAGFLNSPQCFHGQVRSTGAVNASPFNEAPSIDGDDGTDAFAAQLIGKKFPIRIEIDGAADLCRMTVAGRTRTYRDSRYSRMVGTETSGFFVEWGAPDAATQYYWCVHTIAVNAPSLEESPTFEGGPYGVLLHELQARGAYPNIPGRPRIMNGVTAFNASQAPQSTDPLGIVGNPHIGYAPYFCPAPTAVAFVMGISDRATAKLESVAPSANVALHTIPSLPTLASYTGQQLGNGSWAVTTYLIRFGANTNTKRLRIIRDAGGATRFDSGDFLIAAGNNVQAVLKFYQFKHSASWKYVTVLEWSIPGSNTPYRIQTYSEAATAAVPDRLYVTGTALGDVTIDHHWTEVSPKP
jgi:hypothetical protein